MEQNKQAVHDFWNKASCGEALYLKGLTKEGYHAQAEERYSLEPEILDFAEFDSYHGKKVLEIGVGLGAEHQKFAEAGANLHGIDLTKRAVEHTRNRFQLFDLSSELQVADAEDLPYDDQTFDLVYSWGVLHHSPNTPKAINEVYRVIKSGGVAKIMIYHKYSLVGLMLWLRYALMRLKPFTSLDKIYSQYLESPGTKAFSVSEAHELFGKFKNVKINTSLSHGDLLTSSAGQRHQGLLLKIARIIWPRWFIRTFLSKYGLCMQITAEK